MTQQAERTRNIKYVLAERGRWLMHRRRDTKKTNIPGCRGKKMCFAEFIAKYVVSGGTQTRIFPSNLILKVGLDFFSFKPNLIRLYTPIRP